MSNTSSPRSKLGVERMKRDAKHIAKSQKISHAQALEQQAKPLGYANWSMLMQHVRNVFVPIHPPVWCSSNTIGQEYAISGHMVRKVLLANAYIDVYGATTQKALDAEVFQIKMIESKYTASTEFVPFLLWSESLVATLLDEPNELDSFCHVTTGYQAERRMCEAFTRAGAAMEVSFSGYAYAKMAPCPPYKLPSLPDPVNILAHLSRSLSPRMEQIAI